MQKRDNNLRAAGKTSVSVDIPLRIDISAMAAERGMTAAEYLRMKVDEDKRANPQGVMVPMASGKKWTPGVGAQSRITPKRPRLR